MIYKQRIFPAFQLSLCHAKSMDEIFIFSMRFGNLCLL